MRGQSNAVKASVLETEQFILRPLDEPDVSLEWGRWLDDPETARRLNTPQRTLNADDLRDYVRRFDQERSVLLGLFAKPSNTHIGLLTIHTSDGGDDALLNVLVADGYRSIGGLKGIRALRVAVGQYLFRVRRFRSVYASALSDNLSMIAYLQSAGWRPVNRKTVSDQSDGAVAAREVLTFRLTEDAWRRRNHVID